MFVALRSSGLFEPFFESAFAFVVTCPDPHLRLGAHRFLRRSSIRNDPWIFEEGLDLFLKLVVPLRRAWDLVLWGETWWVVRGKNFRYVGL